ncbi:MAG: hypothetical protein ACYC7D_02305 [Nitrososphaerales archaeon]
MSHETQETKPVKRVEDRRFLTGRADYVDDSMPEKVAYLGILRSPYAHAWIKKIDFSRIVGDKNLVSTLTGEEASKELDPIFEMAGQKHTGRAHLALEKARFVGEAIAAIIVRDLYALEDLLEKIDVDYEPLPVISTIDQAKKEDKLVYDHWPDNVALIQQIERGDVDSAIANAPFVSKIRVGVRRQAGVPIEPDRLSFITILLMTNTTSMRRCSLFTSSDPISQRN